MNITIHSNPQLNLPIKIGNVSYISGEAGPALLGILLAEKDFVPPASQELIVHADVLDKHENLIFSCETLPATSFFFSGGMVVFQLNFASYKHLFNLVKIHEIKLYPALRDYTPE